MMSVMGSRQWSGAEWMMKPDMATQILVSTILGPWAWDRVTCVITMETVSALTWYPVIVLTSFWRRPSYWSWGSSAQHRDTCIRIIISIVSNIIILLTGHLDCEAGGAEELDLVLLVLVDQVPAEVPGLGRQLGQGQPLVRLLDSLLARGRGLQGE